MSTSQRVSRGFQRLAILLAVVPLLVGATVSAMAARDDAALQCADKALAATRDMLADFPAQCSKWSVMVTAAFAWELGFDLAVTLAVALAVYGVVRAIGWVIRGFMAS